MRYSLLTIAIVRIPLTWGTSARLVSVMCRMNHGYFIFKTTEYDK